jgi:hypothetical protein
MPRSKTYTRRARPCLRSTASRSATIPWRWSRLSSVGAATSFAFAGVLSLAAIITTVTATLALTLVLAFAPVLALFRVRHRLQRDAGFLGVRVGGTHPERSRQKAGNCRAGYHCFGWFHVLTFLSVVDIWRAGLHWERRLGNSISDLCARRHISKTQKRSS